MLIKWVVFCHHESVPRIRDMLLPAVREIDPDWTGAFRELPFRKNPEIRRIFCELSADSLPETVKDHVKGISGHDSVTFLDQEQYMEYCARVTSSEIISSPEKAFVVCGAYKLL